MKALTICQPYAHLIAHGQKFIENRKWLTSHRGPLAIHAGKSQDWLRPGDVERYPDMIFGAVVAVATLSGCHELADLQAGQVPGLTPYMRQLLLAYEHTNGPVCWHLTNIYRLTKPVPCRGRQLLWDLPEDVARAVDGQTWKRAVPPRGDICRGA